MSLSEKLTSAMKADGHDHIRVSIQGATMVGRMSSPDYKYEFFVPHLGHFLSPTCFANWLSSGIEDARHNPDIKVKGVVRGYRKYILYAKFWQLCRMRPRIQNERIDLPFVSYRVHPSGIKEMNRWKEYAPMVKAMVTHILDPELGPSAPFDWDKGMLEEIEKRVAVIASQHGHDPEAMKASTAPKAQKKKKPKAKEQPKPVEEEVEVNEGKEEVEVAATEPSGNLVEEFNFISDRVQTEGQSN